MATLPSFEQLGLVTPQPTEGPLVSSDVMQQAPNAANALGQQVVKTGSDIQRANYYEGNLQRGYADANLKQGAVALQQDIMSDPTNYATASDRFNAGYAKLLNKEKAGIDDPVMQQKYVNQAMSTQSIMQRQVDIFARQASNKDQLSQLDTLKDNMISTSLQNPAIMPANMKTVQDAIQATVQTGALNQAQATLMSQNVTSQWATARLKYMSGADQLKTLQPMMDQMSGKVAAPDPNAPVPDGPPQPQDASAPAANSNLPSTSDTAIPYVMNRFEGTHLVDDDNGSGPSRYGIVAKDNGLTQAQVANMTPQQAMQLYKSNYWDKIGADNMPANMRLVAFDTAVQFGPGTAQKMITAADGDPQKLLDMRAGAYQNLVTSNPDKYGGSAPSWAARQQLLGQAVNGTDKVPAGAAQDWTHFLPAMKVPELYEQATAQAAKEGRQADQANQDAIDQTNQKFVSAWANDKLEVKDILASNLPAVGQGSKQYWINQITAGPDKVDPNDPNVIKQRGIVENMKTDNPTGFQNMDFTTLAGQIPGAEIAKYQQEAAKMRQGDEGIAKDNAQAAEVKTSVSDMLPLAWKGTPGRPLDPATPQGQAAAAFNGNLVSAVKDAQATAGKPLGRDDVRKMASDMLGNVSIKGGGFLGMDKTVPAYAIPAGTPPASVYRGTPDSLYVPETFRTGFARAWQAKTGQPPGENDIRAGYLKSVNPAPVQQ